MSAYVEYLDLSDVEREAVHAWVRGHGINPADVPLDGIRFDTETDEYVITVANRDAGGSKYVGDDGELSTHEERRPSKPLLPWPSRRAPDERAAVVEQFRAALLDGLEQIERHGNGGACVGAGDVEQLIARVTLEVAG